MSDSTNNNGIGFLNLLGLLFIGLKLGGAIDWSWWWVTCPLWGALAIVLSGLLLTVIIAGGILLIRLLWK